VTVGRVAKAQISQLRIYVGSLREMTGSHVVVVFEQVQVVEGWLPSAYRRILQSPSAAESPKQDCGETPSASTLILQLLEQLALSQRLEVGGCGDLASEASNEGLVSGSGGGF
jgi:hypothetical protein